MGIREILESARTIAVVGLSDRPERDSYRVAEYLQEQGYAIIPVNPNLHEWKGIKAYTSLSDVPDKVDIVDIFRRSEHVPGIVQEAIRIGAKAVWMQLGVVHEGAAEKARAAGLGVVMDRCIKIEHSALRIKRLQGKR
jgi:predicted CoA-binding protein